MDVDQVAKDDKKFGDPFFFREKSFRDKWITEHRLLKVQNFYCGVALLTTRDMVHGKWKLSTLPLVSAYH